MFPSTRSARELRRQASLDVDDHHSALALLAGRRHGRPITRIASVTVDRKIHAAALALAPLLLFFLEDLFDDPGIQHDGPPFAAEVRANWSFERSLDP